MTLVQIEGLGLQALQRLAQFAPGALFCALHGLAAEEKPAAIRPDEFPELAQKLEHGLILGRTGIK